MMKKDLLAMRPLKATARMLKIERADVPREIPGRYGIYRRYDQFARCRVENGILKVALFFPDNLRTGGRWPSYEVFVDRSAGKYITYDRMTDKWRTAAMSHLHWPRYINATDGTWMSPAEAKTVQTYLGGSRGGYDGVLDYQEQLLGEALKRRHKRETDPWDADLSLTPGLPRDWAHWVDKVGIPENHIFYRYERKGARHGHCTYCGKDVPITGKPHHNKAGRCPVCRHKITYKSVGKLGGTYATDLHCIYLLQARPDGFMVREFWAQRHYFMNVPESPEVHCSEHMRVLYDSKLEPRPYFWGMYKDGTLRWQAGWPNSSWYSSQARYYRHGDKPGRVYGKTLPHVVKTCLAHSGLMEYIRDNGFVVCPNDYLYRLKDAPHLEQLAKAGLPRLTGECIGSSAALYQMFKNGMKGGLAKTLGIDTPRLGRLRRCNGGNTFLTWLQWEKSEGKVLPDDVIQSFCQWGIKPFGLDFIQGRMSPVQVCNYVRRQMEDLGETGPQVFTIWRDYLSMAKRLKMDTNDAIVYRVKLLRQRHDELVERCYQEDHKDPAVAVLEKFPDVDQICQSIKEKYEYADKKYAVIVPNGVLDIIVEGQRLSHCVGAQDRYWDRIQRKEAYILFLRRASRPNEPYYTMEIEPDGTVRQLRTLYDRQQKDVNAAKGFLTKWQQVVSKRLSSEDREMAAVSRVLREQEFEQMRQDNVIIHAGHLAGRRLVDVLTADLMENAA